jgi:hypothetical protein
MRALKLQLSIFALSLLAYSFVEAGLASHFWGWDYSDADSNSMVNFRPNLILILSTIMPLLYMILLRRIPKAKKGYWVNLLKILTILLVPLLASLLIYDLIAGGFRPEGFRHYFTEGMSEYFTIAYLEDSAVLIFISYTISFFACKLIKGRKQEAK